MKLKKSSVAVASFLPGRPKDLSATLVVVVVVMVDWVGIHVVVCHI